MTTPSLLAKALAARKARLCVLPPREDGSKAPTAAAMVDDRGKPILGTDGRQRYGWEHWQHRMSTEDEVRNWYSNGRTGIGYVCGAVSGNLELFEFDCFLTYERFKATAEALGRGDLVERVSAGYETKTPGGGIHWLYRCEEIAGNTKLACRPKRPDEKQHERDNVKVLIETRGEGGYTVEAPSNGTVHPTGGAYLLVRGSVETIAAISVEERRFLWQLAETFDEMSESAPTADAEPRYRFDDTIRFGPVREAYRQGVIEDFNARSTWEDVLRPHGWEFTKQVGQIWYVRRPGKDGGQSGTINFGGSDRFCVFSSSTDFKQTDRKGAKAGYDKFGAYAVLNHHGDQKAAYHDLSDRGYGDPVPPTPIRPVPVQEAEESAAPFPLDVLPRSLRRLVEEGATALPCPPDFVALPLLTAAGAAIGDAIELELKSGWREAGNISTAKVGDPGSKKTPSDKLALAPLFRIQERLYAEYRTAKADYDQDYALWEKAPKKERGAPPVAPTFPHVLTTDATVESIAPMLLGGKGILLWREELSGWVRSMNQYRSGGKGADRQHYLSMWSRALLKIDRKSSPEPVIVPRPFLGITGGIQPDHLPGLVDAEAREDGFVDRILWSYPDPVPDVWTTEGVSHEPIAAVDALFEKLHALQGAEQPDGTVVPRRVRLGARAMVMWSEWYAAHTAESEAESFPTHLRGPWAKMPGQAARLALILHCAHTVEAGENLFADGVSDWVLSGALELIDDYFKPHARRVFRLLSRQRRDSAVKLLEALKQSGPMLKRDILLGVFRGHMPAARVDALLEELEAAGLAVREVRPRENGAGRPGTWWRSA